MNIPELRKAITVLKDLYHLEWEVSGKSYGEHYSDEFKEAIENILSACQLLCDVSDNLPPKKGILSASEFNNLTATEYSQKTDQRIGYNLAREENILWLTKKMMGIEKILKDYQGEKLIDLNTELHIATEKGFKDLTTAIIQSFGLKKEG